MKSKDLKNISKQDREKKFKELKIELMKSQSSAQKTGSSRIREIKKTIARILTIESGEKK